MKAAENEEDVFRAVADPTRRALLELLSQSERSVTELARPFRMSQSAISQHLGILRKAGLIRGRRSGRRRLYRINSQQLRRISEWAAKPLAAPPGHAWGFAPEGPERGAAGRKVLPFPAGPKEAPGIFRAGAVLIPVRDQEKARLYYTGKLGFEIRRDELLGQGVRMLEVAPVGAETSLSLVAVPGTDWSGRGPSILPRAVFHCSDVERAYRELSRRGVRFSSEPSRQRWSGKAAVFRDPDGNHFLLTQPETST